MRKKSTPKKSFTPTANLPFGKTPIFTGGINGTAKFTLPAKKSPAETTSTSKKEQRSELTLR